MKLLPPLAAFQPIFFCRMLGLYAVIKLWSTGSLHITVLQGSF